MGERAGDFAAMLEAATDLSQRMVDLHGITVPFAVVVLPDGTARIIGVDSREDAPRIVELVHGLVVTLRRQARERGYRAAAICSSGYASRPETGESARAILIEMETPDGKARAIALPYSRGLFGSYVYHEPVEQPCRAVIFAPEDAPTSPWMQVSRRPRPRGSKP
jgi:hypothetical protein